MTDVTSEHLSELQNMVRRIIDNNRYMTLGTVEPDGLSRLSPVYFTHHEYRTLYWVSSPDARHSQNVTRQRSVAIVIFDSSVDPGSTEAVYVTSSAEQVPDIELDAECAVAFRDVGGGARAFAPEELSGQAQLRLYRATVTGFAVHIRGSHPKFGTGIDTRVPVAMP